MKATARVPTVDAKIQARLPPDPEAEARAAVAVAALAAGTNPPLLPRELVRLDRVEWVLRRASFVEIISRLKQQQQNLVGNKHQQPSSSTSECSPRRGPGDAGVGGLEEARGVRVDAVSNVRVGASGLCNENRPNGQEAINSASSSSAAADAAITTSVRLSRPSISPADSREEDEESKKDNDDGGGLLGRLVSIFEFLRSGNSLLLPSDLRMEWESRPDLGLGLLAADDHVFYPLRDALSTVSASQSAQAANRALKESQNSSPKGGNWAGGGASGVRSGELSSWNVLCQEQREGGGGPLTYQDLQVMLRAFTDCRRRAEGMGAGLQRAGLVEMRLRAEGDGENAVELQSRPVC